MKKVVPRITILTVAIIFSFNMFAQDHPKKQSSKGVTEKGSRADAIIGKREQKKALKFAPVKIDKQDSVAPLTGKSGQKTTKTPKKNK